MDRQLLIANRMHYTGWTSQQRIPRDEDAAVSQGCREDLSEIIVLKSRCGKSWGELLCPKHFDGFAIFRCTRQHPSAVSMSHLAVFAIRRNTARYLFRYARFQLSNLLFGIQ
jgi:hypothetical protein